MLDAPLCITCRPADPRAAIECHNCWVPAKRHKTGEGALCAGTSGIKYTQHGRWMVMSGGGDVRKRSIWHSVCSGTGAYRSVLKPPHAALHASEPLHHRYRSCMARVRLDCHCREEMQRQANNMQPQSFALLRRMLRDSYRARTLGSSDKKPFSESKFTHHRTRFNPTSTNRGLRRTFED